MKKMTRITAIALALIFIFFVAVSLSLVVLEAGHNCTGVHCPICHQISALTGTLRITASLIMIIVSLLAAAYVLKIAFSCFKTEYTADTPVTLKTKLSN